MPHSWQGKWSGDQRMYAYLPVNAEVDPETAGFQNATAKCASLQLSAVTCAPVTVENLTQMKLEGTGAASKMALKLACPRFGNLPATMLAPKDNTTFGSVAISFSSIGSRHRCHRNGACILTDEHEPGPECAKPKRRGGASGDARRAGKAAAQRAGDKTYAGAAGTSASGAAATAKRPRAEAGASRMEE